jgi:ketosteroid isomerase-like protein
MLHKTFAIAVLALASVFSSIQSNKSKQADIDLQTTTSIKAVIEAQRQAWNRGDIDGYMAGYEKSDDIVFVSGDNVTRGWQTVRDRYAKNYNSRDKMGTLTFSDLEVTLTAKDLAVVIGSWRLQRANDEPHGKFTLIFKHTKQGWRIIHDHTS